MTAIFDFRQTRTSDSIPISLSVLLNPENMGIAVGISLLSCIEAEILCHIYFRLQAAIFDFSQIHLLGSPRRSLTM